MTSSLAFIVSILNFAGGAGGREKFNILASDDVDGDVDGETSNVEDDEEEDAQERTIEDEALSAEGSDGESNLKVGNGESASDEELVSSDDMSSTEDVEEESDNLDSAGDLSEEENDDDEPVPTDGFFRWSAMENFADDLEKAQEIVSSNVLQPRYLLSLDFFYIVVAFFLGGRCAATEAHQAKGCFEPQRPRS